MKLILGLVPISFGFLSACNADNDRCGNGNGTYENLNVNLSILTEIGMGEISKQMITDAEFCYKMAPYLDHDFQISPVFARQGTGDSKYAAYEVYGINDVYIVYHYNSQNKIIRSYQYDAQ